MNNQFELPIKIEGILWLIECFFEKPEEIIMNSINQYSDINVRKKVLLNMVIRYYLFNEGYMKNYDDIDSFNNYINKYTGYEIIEKLSGYAFYARYSIF